MKTYVLDKNNQAIKTDNLLEWAEWFESADRSLERDAFTVDTKRVTVSTVFLGMDHGFGDNGKPILWETMIFGGQYDDYMERYSSHEDALIGHKKILKMAKRIIPLI